MSLFPGSCHTSSVHHSPSASEGNSPASSHCGGRGGQTLPATRAAELMDHNDHGEQPSWGNDKPFSGGMGVRQRVVGST